METSFVGLQIAVVYEDLPDLIEVRVRATNGLFGGEVTAYAEPDALSSLADALQGFPSTPRDARELVLGAFGPDAANGAVALRFACTDSAGHVALTVLMESDSRFAPAETAHFSMPFEPASLERFVQQLRALRRDAGCAQLPAV